MTEPVALHTAEATLEAVHTRRHATYPGYKPSGIQWLGDVPKHWKIKRLKHLGGIRYGLGEPPPYVDDGLPLIRATDIYRGKININEVRRVDPADVPWSRSPQLKEKDILVVRSGAYTGDSALVTKELDGSIAGYDMVLSVTNAVPEYVAYVLLSKPLLEGQIYLSKLRAAQPHLNAEELGDCVVAFPPIEEQRAIARFLDEQTEKIDDLIGAKRDLLALLKEKRQAVITNAVTKGLDPAAKLEPSGVEWLGDVPEHWDVKRLKWDSAVLRGASPRPIEDPVYFDDDGEYAWVRISDVTAAGTYLHKTRQRLSELGASLSVKLEPGELFLSIAGSVGKPCITEIKCCIHDGFVYFPRLSCNRKFLYYIFASGEPYKGLGKLGTQLNLNTDTVGSIMMAFPPPEEQRAIVGFLDGEMARMDELESVVREAISSLESLRTSIISAAVTGKIDVRGATVQARL